MSQVTRMYPQGEDVSHAVELVSFAETGNAVVGTVLFDGYPMLTVTWDGSEMDVFEHDYGQGDYRETLIAEFMVYVGWVTNHLQGIQNELETAPTFVERVRVGVPVRAIATDYEVDEGAGQGRFIGEVEEHLRNLYPELVP